VLPPRVAEPVPPPREPAPALEAPCRTAARPASRPLSRAVLSRTELPDAGLDPVLPRPLPARRSEDGARVAMLATVAAGRLSSTVRHTSPRSSRQCTWAPRRAAVAS
jgi:hypothetical protein